MQRRRSIVIRACLVLIVTVAPAVVATSGQHADHATPPTPADGMKTPTAVFDAEGRLWRAWVEGQRVLVSSSVDLGRTYAPAVSVTREPEDVDANGESRPKIAVGPAGEVFVSWTRYGERAYTGDIRFSRSTDGGRTFGAPRTINDDGLETGHRFDALAVGPDGTVYLVWIDKRDLERATAGEESYSGAALYYTVSRDRGRTFAPNRKIKDHICECCRIAHAFDDTGRLVLFWRDVMAGSIRDHAMTHVAPDGTIGKVRRVTADGWAIDACPHHGPWLSMGVAGAMHVVWFTGEGEQGPGAFYGRLSSDGRLAGVPVRLGPAEPTTGHAVVLARAKRVLVVWKEARKPRGADVRLMESLDGGRTFGALRELARTAGVSDHPFLLERGTDVYLSWQSAAEGHRLVPIPASAGTR